MLGAVEQMMATIGTALPEMDSRNGSGLLIKDAEDVIPAQPGDACALVRAHFPISSHLEPHETSMSTLGPLALKIVEIEGPVSTDEVARRIAACFGREKAGRRILAVTRQALMGQARLSSTLRNDGDFWLTPTQQANPPVRNRSEEYGATIKADAISMLEIRAALAIARDENAGGTDADLVRCASRLLGFRRVGSDLQARLTEGLAN